jgi:hypothetical protein
MGVFSNQQVQVDRGAMLLSSTTQTWAIAFPIRLVQRITNNNNAYTMQTVINAIDSIAHMPDRAGYS